MSKLFYGGFLCASLVFLAACGLAEPDIVLPTATATGTPISTELPVVETAVPAGFSDDNPIQLVIVPADSEAASAAESAFEEQLTALVDVAIDVVLVDTQAEAAGRLCNSASGIQSAAWLDGMTYATIQARGCGVGVLRSEIDGETGETGVLLLNRETPITEENEDDVEDPTLEDTVDGTICRLAVDDVFSWTLPVIYYATSGISIADVNDVNDIEDNDALVEAVSNGQCSTVGMREAEWEAYLDAAEDDTLENTVYIAQTSPEIPFGVFAFPFSTSLDVITQIEAALVQLDAAAGRSSADTADDDAEATAEAGDNTDSADIAIDADVLAAFFGDGGFQRVSNEDFSELAALLEESGINFAELGN